MEHSQQWKALETRAKRFADPEKHLKSLSASPGRLEAFSLSAAGLFYDYSRQRVDLKTMGLLYALAKSSGAGRLYRGMVRGEKINRSENRAALHTACRDASPTPLAVDGIEIKSDIRAINRRIAQFTDDVHSGRLTGSTGRSFRHAVVIGIGGSYLGTQFIANALRHRADRGLQLHFLSNVDTHNFGEIVAAIDPETTLWIVISKSYTTAETLANAKQAYQFMIRHGLDPAQHVVTVTSKGSPGDNPDNPVLATFHMFDFIGGRYSVTSAVGGVPLSLYAGYGCFEGLLKGAAAMDRHAFDTPAEQSLPLTAALINVWNTSFLKYPATAVVPYAAPLDKLAAHIQQLSMESNGKSVTLDGKPHPDGSGGLIFGETGTNAQHSFFQMAHQGNALPIEFIGVLNSAYPQYASMSKGVTNHQELWANLIAQADALASGKYDADPARSFSGNRPSVTIVIKDLAPESIGALLAFYEARTVYEAFIWGINPFDQFGVELGKKTTAGLRNAMAAQNSGNTHSPGNLTPISAFYLDLLRKGEIPG
jgi:glucose-6-phosphate isomerase